MPETSNASSARPGDNEPIHHEEGGHHITFEPEEPTAPDRRGQVGGDSLGSARNIGGASHNSATFQAEEGVVLGRSMTMDNFNHQVNVDREGVPHHADPKDMTLHEMVEIAGEVRDASAAPGTPNSGLMVNSSFGTFPVEVVRIARQMRGLDETQFLTLADLTQKRAWTNVYSLLQYRGTAWYLPTLRPVEEGEPEFGIGRERTAVLWFTLFGWRMELNLLAYVARAAFLVLLWLSFWSIFPHKDSERKGQIFDPVVMVLFSTIVGGIISRLLRIPPLVCILWMSIMWGNIPSVNYLTSGITTYVRKSATTFGLTVILIRAGLYIKLDELRPMAATFIAFAFLPAAAELISHSFMAKAMFDYPDTNWAFLHGSVAAAVSPAVVVPAVLTLKLDGFGVTRGPGLLMMPAAPAEMVVAIWNINFMSQLTLDTGDVPLWLNIFLGPVQIIGGIVLGVILGALHFGALKVFLSEAKKLPHRNYTQEHMNSVAFNSTCLLVIAGVAVNAYTKYVNLAGGGAIAVTVMAMTTGTLMRRREKTIYFADQFKLMCLQTADLWDSFTMPVLFSMVGSSIDLGKVFTAEFFPKVLACLAVGLACRMIVTQLVTFREKYTIGERVFMAVGWIGKATVQAAIGRVALDRARDIYGEVLAKSGRAAADGNIEKAIQVANSGIVLIMICAPIASLVMVRLGPKLLQHEGTGGLAGGH